MGQNLSPQSPLAQSTQQRWASRNRRAEMQRDSARTPWTTICATLLLGSGSSQNYEANLGRRVRLRTRATPAAAHAGAGLFSAT